MSSNSDFKETKKEFKNKSAELQNTLDEMRNINDVSKYSPKKISDLTRIS